MPRGRYAHQLGKYEKLILENIRCKAKRLNIEWVYLWQIIEFAAYDCKYPMKSLIIRRDYGKYKKNDIRYLRLTLERLQKRGYLERKTIVSEGRKREIVVIH